MVEKLKIPLTRKMAGFLLLSLPPPCLSGYTAAAAASGETAFWLMWGELEIPISVRRRCSTPEGEWRTGEDCQLSVAHSVELQENIRICEKRMAVWVAWKKDARLAGPIRAGVVGAAAGVVSGAEVVLRAY